MLLNLSITLLNSLVFAFLAALLLTTASLLLLIRRTKKAVATTISPRLRDQHQMPIPRLGGVGILVGWLATLLLLAVLPFEQLYSPLSSSNFWMLISAVPACGLGFLDDQHNLRARYKLLGQIALGIFTAAVIFHPETLQLPLIGLVEIGWIGGPLMVLWVVGVMNAINLVDGLDGLAGGLSLVTTLLLGILCWWHGELALALFSLALAGAILGFWLFNKPPATLFMGDSGSMLLGYLLAVFSAKVIAVTGNGSVSLVPVLLLGIPLVDTAFAFLRRYLKGIPFYAADKDHLHHRCLQKGLSVWQTTLLLNALGLFFGLLGVAAHLYSAVSSPLIMGFVLLVYGLLYWLEYDVIVQPSNAVRSQPQMRKQRDLVRVLSENAEVYFAKDRNTTELLHSFRFWAELLDIRDHELLKNQILLHRQGIVVLAEEDRLLEFSHDSFLLRFRLRQQDLQQDSDLKDEYLRMVVPLFLEQYQRLHQPTEGKSLRVISTTF
jgi:UDP-GlcNAc:undecaprenyl-phosphate GlcNAc-1-phosphate transferase